jgi:transposase
MLVAFFDDEGIVHGEFEPSGTSVTVAFYLDVLTRLRESDRRKRPQKWKKGWELHHDNAPSHTAMGVQQFLAKNHIPIVSHPPYSPDLAPSDFWLFPALKMGLRGRSFGTVKYIKENTDARLRAIKKEDFHQFYNNWIDKWNKCVCVHMENTSKAIKFVNHGFHTIKTYSHISGSFLMLLECAFVFTTFLLTQCNFLSGKYLVNYFRGTSWYACRSSGTFSVIIVRI